MPLHLLGKKSWNVYNTENIDRVRRDEALARETEKRTEQTQQYEESEQRLQALRGLKDDPQLDAHHGANVPFESTRRKRKRIESDDDQILDKSLTTRRRDNSNAHDGNSTYRERGDLGKGPEKPNQLDHISNMKFRDAGGKQSSSLQPWYLESDGARDGRKEANGTDVWGNEDLRRQDRDRARVIANDPLVSMKRGVKQLHDAEKQRREWKAQRERDLYEVEELARRHHRHRRRRHSNESKAKNNEKHEHRSRHRSSERSRKHRTEYHRPGV